MRDLLLLACSAALCATACDDKKAASEEPRADAGASTDKYATADPKLANVLQTSPSASAADANGPPPDGIFPPGAADKRHPTGAPTTLELVSQGAEPRISLGLASTDAGGAPATLPSGRAALEMATQYGPRTGIVLDFGLMLGPEKKDNGGSDWLVAEIKHAAPADRQLGQLAPGTDRQVAELDGEAIRIKMSPDGRESDVDVRPGKAGATDMDRFAQNAAEALVLATVPLPRKPVGVGAQWIAETRMPWSGLDVIAYRAYRVKEIQGDRVHLAVNVKAYAATPEVKLQGVPKGAVLQQFDSQSQGDVELVRGEALARKFDEQQRAVLVFQAPGAADNGQAPGQPPGAGMLTAQLQSQATLVRGDDLRMTAK